MKKHSLSYLKLLLNLRSSTAVKSSFVLFLLLSAVISSSGQSVGINADGSNPNDNAMLEIKSPATGNGKGLLIPRVTEAQRTTASSSLAGGLLNDAGELRGGTAHGLLVYQTDGNQGFLPLGVSMFQSKDFWFGPLNHLDFEHCFVFRMFSNESHVILDN